ncbi:MAG: crotonase/enoyl-CoA hydratase family protein [Acidimicrobiales bacterium]
MDFTQIEYAVEDQIATITLDRPHRMNAFTETMCREMLAAFDLVDADDDVRVVIVTGRGRAFCAGADLGSGGSTFDADVQSGRPRTTVPRDGGGLVTLRIYECTKPVIAAMNGSAVGIGVTMTLPMDIRVLADSAKVGFVFASRGIVPEAASSWFLPRVVGINQALEWCLTARVFRAQEARDGGLVRSIHPADEVLGVARALAAEIVANAAPVSAALTRQMMWRMLGADHPMEAHKVDSRGIFDTGRAADAREGIASFLEKRPPTWTMAPSRDMPDWYPWWEQRSYE